MHVADQSEATHLIVIRLSNFINLIAYSLSITTLGNKLVSIKFAAQTEAVLNTPKTPIKYGSALGDEFASCGGEPYVEAFAQPSGPRLPLQWRRGFTTV